MQKMIITVVIAAIITALVVVGVMALFGAEPNPAVVAGVTGGVAGATAVTAGRKSKLAKADRASENPSS